MWISRKKYNALEKRIADLEGQVQSQQKCNIKVSIDGKQICLMAGKSTLTASAEDISLDSDKIVLE